MSDSAELSCDIGASGGEAGGGGVGVGSLACCCGYGWELGEGCVFRGERIRIMILSTCVSFLFVFVLILTDIGCMGFDSRYESGQVGRVVALNDRAGEHRMPGQTDDKGKIKLHFG